MYFYVDLLIKCRDFEKATKFEITACCFFIYVCSSQNIWAIKQWSWVFFWSIYYIVEVLLLKYMKRYANRCIVMWSSKKISFFSLTRQLKYSRGHSGHTGVCTAIAQQTQSSHTAYRTERLFGMLNLIFIWINLLYIHLYTYYVFLCQFADKM